jgi:nitroreductase
VRELSEILGSRRSVRAFKPEAPADDLLEEIIADAITAPSASNKQPWRFFIVKDPDVIASMAAAVRQAVEKIARHIPAESEESFRKYGDYFTRFEAAPVVIVPIHRGHRILSHMVDDALDETTRAHISTMERDSGLIGTSLALMNLLLAAHDRGLGASGMTGPLVAVERLSEILRVPPSWGIVALVPIGYPDEAPRATARKAVDKVVRWIR